MRNDRSTHFQPTNTADDVVECSKVSKPLVLRFATGGLKSGVFDFGTEKDLSIASRQSSFF